MAMVCIPRIFRDLAGDHETLTVSGTTVGQLIDALARDYPMIRDQLCEGDELRAGLSVVVDGHVAVLGLMQPVEENSEVHFLPAIAGG